VTDLVKVKRHGRTVILKRTKVEKVALPPQVIDESTTRVAFGRGTTVSGALATTNGIALRDRTVQILTAPTNQLGQWSQAAIVTTTAEGTWKARLPPGPSRLVEASYAGDSTTLSSTSTTATLSVPARIGITIVPRQMRWSAVVTIRGHLAGGYVPPDGVPLYLEIQLPHRHRPYKPVPFRTNANGTFAIERSWGSGAGVATYPTRVALLGTCSDYPFSATSSRAVKVTFGRMPPPSSSSSSHDKHGRCQKHRRRRTRHRKR
jgi:hypothetical protein